MKVLILGASGIIGQTMRLCIPAGIEPAWYRREADLITKGVDLDTTGSVIPLLEREHPAVIVNLAGHSDVDAVEREPHTSVRLNVDVPEIIVEWAKTNDAKYVHISSQAVFGGSEPPYFAQSPREPVNKYGEQKVAAERAAQRCDAVIVRPSLVLGIRPLPHVGRKNPLEAMLEGQKKQVVDRWFSPLLAWDAAELIWDAALYAQPGEIRNLGIPSAFSRFEIATAAFVGRDFQPVSHADFPEMAPRPENTTYADGRHKRSLIAGLFESVRAFQPDQDRAIELALFFGMRLDDANAKLGRGFGPLHNAVTDDFRIHGDTDKTEDKLLDWYRTTEAYTWELSAYHEDKGFNYAGMCEGIAIRLRNEGVRSVLCLGDGIGDLTLSLHRAGFKATYHDLAGSRTAAYAAFRFWRQTGEVTPDQLMTTVFDPGEHEGEQWDAVVSLDFLEHVNCVPKWAEFIRAALKSGGIFVAQNAFACGSGPNGPMPMHLACNDRWEKEWDPLLSSLGFTQEGPQWYRKAK